MATTGKIRFFDVTRGFGFLIPDDGSADVFLHSTELKASGIDVKTNPPVPDQPFRFDLAPGRKGKGPKAVSISRL